MKAEGFRRDILFLGWEATLERLDGLAGFVDDGLEAMIQDAVEQLIHHVQHQPASSKIVSPLDIAPLRSRLQGVRAAQRWCATETDSDGVAEMSVRFEGRCLDACQEWIDANLLFTNRFYRDRAALASFLGVRALAPVTGVLALGSDVHDDGGSVLRVSFSDGKRVIYKPRPMTGELLWHELLQYTSGSDDSCAARAGQVLDRVDYGWMEDLHFDSATLRCNEAGYWEKAGSLMCHAVVCGMTDLHLGNVIATSRGPAIADAECLGSACAGVEDAQDPLVWLVHACLETGLVDCRRTKETATPDLSGFFGGVAEVSGLFVPATDGSCRLNRVRLKAQENRLRSCTILTVLPHLVRGFCKTARTLISIHDLLTAADGWYTRLRELHAPRVIVRDTLRYGLLISQGMLEGRDAIKEGLAAEKIRQSLQLTPQQEVLLRASEVRSLSRLHIPRFHVPAGTRQLIDGENGVIAPQACHDDAPARIFSRMQRMHACTNEHLVTQALLHVGL